VPYGTHPKEISQLEETDSTKFHEPVANLFTSPDECFFVSAGNTDQAIGNEHITMFDQCNRTDTFGNRR
jgi:hypothetical protein